MRNKDWWKQVLAVAISTALIFGSVNLPGEMSKVVAEETIADNAEAVNEQPAEVDEGKEELSDAARSQVDTDEYGEALNVPQEGADSIPPAEASNEKGPVEEQTEQDVTAVSDALPDGVAEVGGTIYTDFSEAYTAAIANDGAAITVLADTEWVVAAASLTIKKNLNIDLNGHVLTLKRQDSTKGFYIDLTVAGKTLTVRDSSESKSGKLYSPDNTTYLVRLYKGNFTLESGTLESVKATRTVYVYSDKSTFTMTDGALVNAKASAGDSDANSNILAVSSGTANISGGSIRATHATAPVRGVNIGGSDASVTISGGNISTGAAHAIWSEKAGTLVLTKASFDGCTGASVYYNYSAGNKIIGSDGGAETLKLPCLSVGSVASGITVKDNVIVENLDTAPNGNGKTDYSFKTGNVFGGRYGNDFSANILGIGYECQKIEGTSYYQVVPLTEDSEKVVAAIRDSEGNVTLSGELGAAMTALKNGDTLTLKKDAVNTSSSSYKITASNVTIDLAGHNVTANEAKYGIWVWPSASKIQTGDTVRIVGGDTITGKEYAVFCNTNGSSNTAPAYTLDIGSGVKLSTIETGGTLVGLSSQNTRLYMETAPEDYAAITDGRGKTVIDGKTYIYANPVKAVNEQPASGGTVELIGDYTLSATGKANIALNEGKVVLDLKGHTISMTGQNGLICDGKELVIQDGILDHSYKSASAKALGAAVLVPEAGMDSSSLTFKNVVINEGSSYATAFSVNGTLKGVKVDVDNSTINCTGTGSTVGIYFPVEGGTLNMNHTKVTAMNAVQIKGGTVNIEGEQTVITSTGPKGEPGSGASGCTNTGDGIYVEDNYGYQPVVNITGGKVISENANALNFHYTVKDGIEAGKMVVSGGSFSSPVENGYCADTYYPIVNDDGTYGVTNKEQNVKPAIGTPSVELDKGIEETAKEAVKIAAEETKVVGLNSYAAQRAQNVTDEEKVKIEETQKDNPDAANIYVQVYLEVTPKAYTNTENQASYIVDITPMSRLIVSTADNQEDIKLEGEDANANAKVVEGTEHPVKVSGEVTVEIPLPDGSKFADETKVSVRHTKYKNDNKTIAAVYAPYSASVVDREGKKVVSFSNPNGFSQFEILYAKRDGDKVLAGSTWYQTIAAAIEAGETNIMLAEDTEEDVIIESGENITLDLAGHTLKNQSSHTITVNLGGILTVKDSAGGGTVDNITNGKAAVYNNGTANLQGGSYTRSQETGDVSANKNSYYNILNHGEMVIDKDVTVTQDGNFSSLVASGYYDYSNNSNELMGYVAGIGQAEPKLTIKGGSFNGGINTIKNDDGSELIIEGGKFINTTQAAIMNVHKATIKNGTFESSGVAIINGGWTDSAVNKGELTVSGGSFKAGSGKDIISKHSEASTVGTPAVSSGTFSAPIPTEYCADGYVPVTKADEDGNYTVTELKIENATAIVKVGDTVTPYRDLPSALAEAERAAGSAGDGETVTVILKKDASLSGDTVISEKVTLKVEEDATLEIVENAKLDVYGELINYNGTITGKGTVNIYAKDVALDKTSIELKKGESASLAAIVTPGNATESAEWSSDNAAVTVDENGNITVNSCAGAPTATITVTVGTKSASCSVTVKHTEVKDAAVAATCTEEGKKEGSHCSGCNEVLEAQEVIPATGHTWGTVPEWAWTETDSGYSAGAVFICMNDGSHKHPEEAAVTSTEETSTCTVAGKIVYTAKVTFDGTEYTGTKIAELGLAEHQFGGWTEGTPATCRSSGTHGYQTCSVCNGNFDKDGKPLGSLEIPATGHSPAVEWSHDENGHFRICKNGCGTHLNEAPHTFIWKVDKKATTTEKGNRHKECSVCGYEKESEEIPVLKKQSTNTTSKKSGTKTGAAARTGDSQRPVLWILLAIVAFFVAAKEILRRVLK